MDFYDILFKIIAALSPFLTFALGLLASKIKKLQEKNEQNEIEKQELISKRENEEEAMKEACKYMLKKSLKEDYDYYLEQGWCSAEDKEEVDRIYFLYRKQLGGNGSGTRYYDSISSLPEHPPKKQ